MRISQDTADRIARALTKKSYEKWQKAKREVNEGVTKLYEKKIPDELKAALDKYPDWFCYTSTIYLIGVGFGNNDSETATKQMPQNQGGSYCKLKMTDKEAEAIKSLIHARDKAEKTWEDLKRETYNTLLALGTYKKVTEHFPQAANMLPTTAARCVALIPSLDGLTNKLKNQ